MSARTTAQTAVGMHRLMNPFDPIDPSILRTSEEMQRALNAWSGRLSLGFAGRSERESPRQPQAGVTWPHEWHHSLS